jgi:cytochrome c oxidase subunit 4
MSEVQIDPGAAEIESIREERAQAHARHPGAKEYVRIFLILIAITAVEVALYYIRDQLGSWFIPTLFLLAGAKFTLVVLWFMHLKFDSRRYSRFFVMGLAGAMTLYMIVLITFKVFLR